MTTQNNYESASEYQADAYTVDNWGKGIAFSVLGWETAPDSDTEWSGCENRTGNLVMRMIGDDQKFSVDPGDVTELAPKDFCRECGQIGCTHNVYE